VRSKKVKLPKVGAVVQTTLGMLRVGIVEAIRQDRTTKPSGAVCVVPTLLVRWEDARGELTEVAPEVVTTEASIVDGLVLLARRAAG
jgi:hypothetical protein